MKFPKQDMLDVQFDDQAEDSPYKIIEKTAWKLEYKDMCTKDTYFEFEGKFYCLTSGRSGSHYTDYYYNSDDWDDLVECPEVEQVEVTKYEWRTKNNGR